MSDQDERQNSAIGELKLRVDRVEDRLDQGGNTMDKILLALMGEVGASDRPGLSNMVMKLQTQLEEVQKDNRGLDALKQKFYMLSGSFVLIQTIVVAWILKQI